MEEKPYSYLTGNFYEDLAAEALREHGFRILEQNFTTHQGEIDIIAFKNRTYHFVEVKSMTVGKTPFRPEHSVTYKKMGKILSVASSFLRIVHEKYGLGIRQMNISFDVIAIQNREDGSVESCRFFERYYLVDVATFKDLLILYPDWE